MKTSEREAVERVIRRMHRDRLVKTGGLLDPKEAHLIEKKAKKAAEESDNQKRQR
ncbi:MAG: hypothetical protein HY894_07890 [Deltaproteobacteria bacterium]|nr:hypothetical protein [Deltaproteobacteria bacterium]